MQIDRFTIKSQEALQAAQQLAEGRRNPQLTPEHLLAVLLEQDAGVVVPVLQKLGAEPGATRAEVNAAIDALPTVSGEPAEPAGPPPMITMSLTISVSPSDAADTHRRILSYTRAGLSSSPCVITQRMDQTWTRRG